MTSIIEEAKSKDNMDYTPLSESPKPPEFHNRRQKSCHISNAEMNMMEHRGHTTMTHLPHLPAKYMLNARQSALSRARSRSRGIASTPDSAFTPRVTVGGAATDAANADANHYTPDWFKMSIRTVDRDGARHADV